MDVIGPGREIALVVRVGDELFCDRAGSGVGGHRDVDVVRGQRGEQLEHERFGGRTAVVVGSDAMQVGDDLAQQ